MPFRYTIYGLTFDSDFEFADLPIGKAPACINVYASSLTDSLGPDKPASIIRINVPTVARFQVEEGSIIRIEPATGADINDIRLYLLGSIFAIIMQQRGDLPLHASAVIRNEEAILFSGPSGIGKSTTALSMIQHSNWTLCADDVSRFQFLQGQPNVYPAYPSMKIWKDVVQNFSAETQALTAIKQQPGKYYLPMPRATHASTPIRHLFLLQRDPSRKFEFESVKGSLKFSQLRENIYRPNLLKKTSSEPRVFEKLLKLSETLPVSRIYLGNNTPNQTEAAHLAQKIEQYLNTVK